MVENIYQKYQRLRQMLSQSLFDYSAIFVFIDTIIVVLLSKLMNLFYASSIQYEIMNCSSILSYNQRI